MENEVIALIEERRAELMNKDYLDYVKVNGYHFSDRLADMASKLLLNKDQTAHRWSTEQVKRCFKSLGLKKRDKDTWGDVTYEANKFYSMLYPRIDEYDCIRFASFQSVDENNYDGMAFMRFVCDMIGRDMCIDFERYV